MSMSGRVSSLTIRVYQLSVFAFVFWVAGIFTLRGLGVSGALLNMTFAFSACGLLLLNRPSLARVDIVIAVYTLLLIVVLLSFSFFSINFEYSGIRVVVSCGLFYFFYLLCTQFIRVLYGSPEQFGNLSNRLLLFFVIYICVSGLLNPNFRGGGFGFRLSGGVNANTMGMIGMVLIMWVHLCCAIKSRWTKVDYSLLFLALVISVWSFSRAALAAILVYYLVIWSLKYFGTLFTFGLRKSHIFYAALVVVVIAIAMYAFSNLSQLANYLPVFSYLEERLEFSDGGDSNLNSRKQAWDILLAYYHADPLLGGVGWYNATNLLDSGAITMASSPHSLYVRLLSEVGLLGALMVLSFPLMIGVFAAFRCLKTFSRGQASVFILIIASLCSIFLREIVEDSYMTSYMHLPTSVVLFLAALTFHHGGYNGVSR